MKNTECAGTIADCYRSCRLLQALQIVTGVCVHPGQRDILAQQACDSVHVIITPVADKARVCIRASGFICGDTLCSMNSRGHEHGLLRCGGDFSSVFVAVAIVVRAHILSGLPNVVFCHYDRVSEGRTACNKYSV